MVLLIQLPYCSRPVTIIAVVFARRRAVLLCFFHLFVFVFSGRLLGILLCRFLSYIMFFFLSGFFYPSDLVALLLLAAVRLLSWSDSRRSCLVIWTWRFIRRDEITRGVLMSYAPTGLVSLSIKLGALPLEVLLVSALPLGERPMGALPLGALPLGALPLEVLSPVTLPPGALPLGAFSLAGRLTPVSSFHSGRCGGHIYP